MADGLTRREMNPHLRIVLHRRVGNQPHLVTIVEPIHVPVASREYGPVDGGAKYRGLAFGKRWGVRRQRVL